MIGWTRHLFHKKRVVSLLHPPSPEELSRPRLEEVPPVGAVLRDRYRLDAVVGRGGSSVVYRATDLLLGTELAVKVLAAGRAPTSAGDQRARHEAVLAMRLSHPHIARVFHYERHEPWQLLVMEYLAGEDLHATAKRRPDRRLLLPDLLRVGVSCLDALAYAHEAGVVHNDVKPSNVILTRAGTLKICDFGLAQLTEDATGSWLASASAGSQGFMSPERIKGEPCDGRSDLYSLAATLYTLGAGHTPFGTEFAQAWRGHLELPPPPPRHLPPSLFRVVEIAMRKEPDQRFRSAAQMKQALLEAFRALRPVERTSSKPRRSSKARPKMTPVQPRPGALEAAAEVQPWAAPRPLAPPPRAPSRPSIRLAPPPGMVRIGERVLASRFGGEHEVRAFWLQRCPVTNDEFLRFVEETGAPSPAHWIGGRPPPQRGRHPVVGVSLDGARAFAAWAGLRLPSDVEWEAAARGARSLAFPWGEGFEPHRCNCPDHGLQDTTPVDHHPEGASDDGVLDLVGNVWEWTDPERAAHAAEPGYAWVFGGSFRHPCVRGAGIPRTAVGTSKEYLYLGFRCALEDRGAP